MATLYVENVPDDLYEALRAKAREKRSSIAAEIISLIRENIPTQEELRRRKKLLIEAAKLRAIPSPGKGPFQTTEEVQREDRSR